MNPPTAQQFFYVECVAHARQLPLADAILFLSGMLQSCSDEKALAPVRNCFITLSESDKQLELIQTGQMKLDFGKGHNGGKP